MPPSGSTKKARFGQYAIRTGLWLGAAFVSAVVTIVTFAVLPEWEWVTGESGGTIATVGVVELLLAPTVTGWVVARRTRSERAIALALAGTPSVCGLFFGLSLFNAFGPTAAAMAARAGLGLLAILVVAALGRVGARARERSGGRFLLAVVVGIAIDFVGIGLAESVFAEVADAKGETQYAVAMNLCLKYFAQFPAPVNWDDQPLEIWRRHQARLQRASQVCGHNDDAPCQPFLRELRATLAEFRNGHTAVSIDGDFVSPALLVEEIEGRPVITGVGVDSDAGRGGLLPGMEIMAVDELPTAEALRAVPSWAVSYKGERTRRKRTIMKLLKGHAGTPVTVTARDLSGRDHVVVLQRPEFEPDADPVDESSEIEVTNPNDGIVKLWLDGFNGDGLPERVRAAVDQAPHSKGIILDLRENHGGHVFLMLRVVGMFFGEPTTIGDDCEDGMLDDGLAGVVCEPVVIEPVAPLASDRLAVLIGPRTFSAGEVAAYALCSTGRAACFGEATAGELDTTEFQQFPGGEAAVAVGSFRPALPVCLDGEGVQPQFEVRETISDLARDRDPTVEAAMRWLRGDTLAVVK